MLQYLLPILFVTFLSAGWVVVQLIARKMKTKNHFDDLDGSSCSGCTCGGTGNACVNKPDHK